MRQEDRVAGPTEAPARLLECATLALGEGRAKDVPEQIRTFEGLPDDRRLTGALATPGASR
jgi:hypothetical protein